MSKARTFVVVALAFALVGSTAMAGVVASDTFDSTASTTGLNGSNWGGVVNTYDGGGMYTPSVNVRNERTLSGGALDYVPAGNNVYWMLFELQAPNNNSQQGDYTVMALKGEWGQGVTLGAWEWSNTLSLRTTTSYNSGIPYDGGMHTLVAKIEYTAAKTVTVTGWADPDLTKTEAENAGAQFASEVGYFDAGYGAYDRVRLHYATGQNPMGSFDEFLLTTDSPFSTGGDAIPEPAGLGLMLLGLPLLRRRRRA